MARALLAQVGGRKQGETEREKEQPETVLEEARLLLASCVEGLGGKVEGCHPDLVLARALAAELI